MMPAPLPCDYAPPRDVQTVASASPVMAMPEPGTLAGMTWCVHCQTLQPDGTNYCRHCLKPLN